MKSDKQGILLTGASGYIGYNFTKYLVSKGFAVHLSVRNSSNLRDLNHLHTAFIHIYNGEQESIEKIFNNHNIDLVFHLATYYDKSDDSSTLSKLNDVCINLTNQLFYCIRDQNKQIRFINVGTIWQTHEKFDNAYSMYKSFQEEIVKFYSKKYDIKVLSLLLTDTYGPNDWRPKLLNLLKSAVINGNEFQIIDPNTQVDFVYIDDICDALYQSMYLVMNQQSSFCNYKVQSYKTIGIRAVIDTLEIILDYSINVKFGEGKIASEVVLAETIQPLPGWVPRIDFNTGLIRLFEEEE